MKAANSTLRCFLHRDNDLFVCSFFCDVHSIDIVITVCRTFYEKIIGIFYFMRGA